MEPEALLTFAIAVLALALKPGPGMTMVMSRTISGGMSACFAFMAGFLLVTFAYLAVALAGFKLAGDEMVFITILMKTLAATYLIWIGIKGILHPEVSYGSPEVEGHSFFDNFSSAALLTASNPLVIVFYAGILPTLVDVGSLTIDDMSLIILIVLGIEGIIPVLYCLPFALFRKKISEEFLKHLRIFSSVVLILIGLYIGASTIFAEDLVTVTAPTEGVIQ